MTRNHIIVLYTTIYTIVLCVVAPESDRKYT